ncbi:hypothetical protein [Rhizobium tubonense]|uniref:Uncharacterized protein n=1 Tax=Rhizobium tubonense TaxID=484088 RepID=A0A2W4C4U3_9HYPH|nr:hypothetical protein [Rhizobium tubonense]PZM08602.1 hypothetical protein CPY51_28390 [Rhizobium tubonense]
MTGMDRYRAEELPLYPEDIALCQRVFDAVRRECGFEREPETCEILARHVIDHYRRGVKDEVQLGRLAKSMMNHRRSDRQETNPKA